MAFLLENGGDPRNVDSSGRTAMYWLTRELAKSPHDYESEKRRGLRSCIRLLRLWTPGFGFVVCFYMFVLKKEEKVAPLA